jgi:putative membrane protein
MYWHGGGWGPGAWVAMTLMMLLFWGAVVAAIVFAVRAGHREPGSAAPRESDAERILAERFARGEIDADEYTRRRDLLRET